MEDGADNLSVCNVYNITTDLHWSKYILRVSVCAVYAVKSKPDPMARTKTARDWFLNNIFDVGIDF